MSGSLYRIVKAMRVRPDEPQNRKVKEMSLG